MPTTPKLVDTACCQLMWNQQSLCGFVDAWPTYEGRSRAPASLPQKKQLLMQWSSSLALPRSLHVSSIVPIAALQPLPAALSALLQAMYATATRALLSLPCLPEY